MRRRRTFSSLGLLALLAAAAPLPAATVDEVIARHVAARGGDRWESIETMRITGSYTAFSKVGPFTLVREQGNKYRLDCHWNLHPVTIAYDGEEGWQINPMFGRESAQKITGLDRQVLLQDVDFATPLFHYRERGNEVELLGNGDFEGQETIRIRLQRPDGFEETWYLDPETFLEVGRDSPGSDFGDPHPQRTYFDDFREVAGVKVPHYVETQFYTRTRVMEVESVEVGVEVDEAIFRLPPPPGMDRLLPLVGEWRVEIVERPQPGAPWTETEETITIEKSMGGTLVRERTTTAQGNEIETTLTYDRFRERYVQTAINDFTNHMDVREGAFDDQGRLTVSNVGTGTSWSGFGRTFHGRSSYFDIGEDGFRVEHETSVDGGESWFVSAKLTYARKTE